MQNLPLITMIWPNVFKMPLINKELFLFQYNKDNLGYVIHDEKTRSLIGIDFGDFDSSRKVVDILEKELKDKPRLKYIMTTHSHWDHSNGNAYWELYRQKTIEIISGKSSDSNDIVSSCSKYINDGKHLSIGDYDIQYIHTPGHMKSHYCFYITHHRAKTNASPLLFTGDTLFHGSCGRLFNGTYKEHYLSLSKLKNLNQSTNILPGHDYSYFNAKWCHKLNPQSKPIQSFLQWTTSSSSSSPKIGLTLTQERLINPFLNTHLPYYLTYTNTTNPFNSFITLRLLKDSNKIKL